MFEKYAEIKIRSAAKKEYQDRWSMQSLKDHVYKISIIVLWRILTKVLLQLVLSSFWTLSIFSDTEQNYFLRLFTWIKQIVHFWIVDNGRNT